MIDKPITARDIQHWILWNKFFDENIVYCGDTHSFVHRLFDRRKKWKTYSDAQNDAFSVMADMLVEFDSKYQSAAQAVKKKGKEAKK